jgi:26S proteasome regulatory subunit N1
LVTRIGDSDDGIVKLALETLRSEIKSSTSSMTAVPKPLKFLRPHFDTLRTAADTMKEGSNKVCKISSRRILNLLCVLRGRRFSCSGSPV